MLEMYEPPIAVLPCLIVAHSDEMYQAAIARGFRQRGWDVYLARDGPQVRRLVPMLEADAVILDAELPGESGWLTCAKLQAEQPSVKVVLVTREPGSCPARFAAFVGALALVRHSAGLAPLLDELHGLNGFCSMLPRSVANRRSPLPPADH